MINHYLYEFENIIGDIKMKKLKIATLNGNGYELGWQFSQLFDNVDNDFSYFRNLLEDKNIRENLDKVKEKIKVRYPSYLEEMYARADGFNVNRDVYLLNICFEIYESKEACTDIIVKVDDECMLLGHNEDISENLDQIALVKYNCHNGYFCELSLYNCPQGTTFGWNSYGIIYSVNSISLKEVNELGIPVWFILRDIVECKSIEEVIDKINIADCASSFSLNIIDSHKNKAYSIEKVLDKLDVLEIKDKYIHTNHIIHPNMKSKICEIYNSSLIRIDTGTKLLNNLDIKNINLDNIRKILQFNDSDTAYVYQNTDIDDSLTVATFLFNSYTKEIQIYSYYDGTIVKDIL